MPIEDADLAEITKLLSPERLGKLHELTGNSRAAIEFHQKTLRLGADLMAIIAVIEIALRNSICDNLGAHFAQAGWLLTPPAPFQWKDSERNKITQALDSARRAEYSKLFSLTSTRSMPLLSRTAALRTCRIRCGQNVAASIFR